MAATGSADPRDNLRGALWMLLAMGLFALEDSLFKRAASEMPLAQAMALFGLLGAGIFALDLRRRSLPLFPPALICRAMGIRVIFEATGRLFFFLAISLGALSMATVILQATPITVVAAAAVIFGEKVGWRRWLAIGVGLFGVLLVLRPSGSGLEASALLAVIAMIGFAGRDLASRAAPQELDVAHLGLTGFLTIFACGLGFGLWEARPPLWPGPLAALAIGGAAAIGVVAYSALMRAMRTGEVAAVTPFRYCRLLFGVLLGVVFFNEPLTGTTLLGAGLIVLAGLGVLLLSRKA